MNSFCLITFSAVTFASSFVRANYWAFTDSNYDFLKKLSQNGGGNIGFIPEDYDYGYDPVKLNSALIFPGTKWCGPGDIADDYDDLGSEWETDSCCRAHDNCPDTVAGRRTDEFLQLTNSAFHTRLSCECDETFRRCLHDARTASAEAIGTIYFNILGTKCFRKDHPTTGCLVQGGRRPIKRICLEHSYNTTGIKIYQWFDVPNFK